MQISEAMNIPPGTIAAWSSKGNWQQRIDEDRLNDRAFLSRKIADAISRETLVSIETLVRLRDTSQSEAIVKGCAESLIKLQADIGKFLASYDKVMALEMQSAPILELPVHAVSEELSDDDLEERQRMRVSQ